MEQYKILGSRWYTPRLDTIGIVAIETVEGTGQWEAYLGTVISPDQSMSSDEQAVAAYGARLDVEEAQGFFPHLDVAKYKGVESEDGEQLIRNYVGMPASLHLDEFGSQVWGAFGSPCYHVGSSLLRKQWRDVDVRLILEDDEYERLGLGDPVRTSHNEKWVSLVLAYSALGSSLTGLPVDFQIQQQSWANSKYPGPHCPRSALGIIPLRLKKNPLLFRDKGYY